MKKQTNKIKVCIDCQKEYIPYYASAFIQKRCPDCRKKHHRKAYIKRCLYCGKEFYPFHSTSKFCSQTCNRKANKRVSKINRERTCPTCGNVFLREMGRPSQKYCSRKCSAHRPNRISKLFRKIANKKGLDKLWSIIIKERAFFTCEKCGSKLKQLNSHHIIGRRVLATRWNLENGICLCVSCHKFDKDSAHENPIEFVEWLTFLRGKEFMKNLKELSKQKYGYKEHYDEIREYLNKERDKYTEKLKKLS